MLQVGDKAPEFKLETQSGREVSLADFKGKKIALYFYPKDDTSGCTKQACSLRDGHATLQEKGVVVLGISPDDAKSHAKFATKHSLPFPLLVDTDHAVADAFGAWGEKSMYGRKFMGIMRTTFLIDENGTIQHIWKKPKVAEHADEILKAL
jgi:peroxiredoxin Q/BCP